VSASVHPSGVLQVYDNRWFPPYLRVIPIRPPLSSYLATTVPYEWPLPPHYGICRVQRDNSLLELLPPHAQQNGVASLASSSVLGGNITARNNV
jgi:hypothetical protein